MVADGSSAVFRMNRSAVAGPDGVFERGRQPVGLVRAEPGTKFLRPSAAGGRAALFKTRRGCSQRLGRARGTELPKCLPPGCTVTPSRSHCPVNDGNTSGASPAPCCRPSVEAVDGALVHDAAKICLRAIQPAILGFGGNAAGCVCFAAGTGQIHCPLGTFAASLGFQAAMIE